ncbi:hypothetical protein [Streptomyces formicae]|uniref:Uncharacterized protein n=1 Tax=Streptomyces formicae TaxID=1616117 RepID=A0A291Q5T3_9ACTN|nr:hypothetical protein [Streptomyces formicae]ATL26898.1 hypothetical protein KY5_1880c [Streptomyces formicae]
MTRQLPRHLLKAVLAGSAATLVLGVAAPAATADSGPAAPSAASRDAAHEAAAAPGTLDTLSRFFAREGAVTKAAAQPRIQGRAVPVYYLSPDFVAGKKGASIARLEFLASKAVSSDGQEASLWTVKEGGDWQVVNIATGDDETHYARVGAEKVPGGTVFHEPQINAWYVQDGDHARVLPLDKDAVRAVGAEGTSVAAYRKRVQKAYGDKLPGSAYEKSGKAGGYDTPKPVRKPAQESAQEPAQGPVTVASSIAGAGALLALGISGTALVRRRAARRQG